jgi:hypothetical protein
MSRHVAENSECETNPVRRDRSTCKAIPASIGVLSELCCMFSYIRSPIHHKDEPRTDDG